MHRGNDGKSGFELSDGEGIDWRCCRYNWESRGRIMSTITIRIPDRTEAKLQQIAKAAGKPLEQLVGDVLEAQTSGRRMLEEISGEIGKRFKASGMNEEELAERLEQEDHRSRGVPYTKS